MMHALPLLLTPCLYFTGVDVNIAVTGYAPDTGAASPAVPGVPLAETEQGRVAITATTGSWVVVVVSATLPDPEHPNYAGLIAEYPWLAETPGLTGNQFQTGMPHDLSAYVDGADLDALQNLPIAVRPEDIVATVMQCHAAEFAVRAYGQPALGDTEGTSVFAWKSLYGHWSGLAGDYYWSQTYAPPIGGGADARDRIYWTRLLESAMVLRSSPQVARAFMRGTDLVDAVQAGLRLQIQALSMRGIVEPPSTNPTNAPGIKPQAGLIFLDVTVPVTIAIPYTPPPGGGGQGSPVHNSPAVLANGGPGQLLLATLGYASSATHAIFPASGGGEVAAPIYPIYAGSPIVICVVPATAVEGVLRFEDQVGINEAASIPLKEIPWSPPPI